MFFFSESCAWRKITLVKACLIIKHGVFFYPQLRLKLIFEIFLISELLARLFKMNRSVNGNFKGIKSILRVSKVSKVVSKILWPINFFCKKRATQIPNVNSETQGIVQNAKGPPINLKYVFFVLFHFQKDVETPDVIILTPLVTMIPQTFRSFVTWYFCFLLFWILFILT